MSNPISRSQARTWTIGAQAGALIFVLGAVGVGVMGLPEHEVGSELEKAREFSEANNTGNSNVNKQSAIIDPYRSTAVDTQGISSRLALLDNAPTPPLDPVLPTIPDEDEEPKGPTPDEGMIHRRVKYIGFINSSTTQHAFLRIDGKQRIVSAGGTARTGDEQFDDLQVHRVTPTYIQLSQDNGRRVQIDIAAKSGPSVTSTGDTTIEVVPTESANGSLLTDEEEAYIASLPPRQQPGARRRMEREKRGLTEEPVRRPTPEALVKIRGNVSENGRQPDIQRRNDNRNQNN